MKSPLQDPEYATEPYPDLPNPSLSRTRKLARYIYDRFIRLRGSPEQIAWGAAVGFFVAMSPTMGVQTAIAVPIAAFFRINKVAAAATVWLTNPITAPFIYGFNYMVGAKLLGHPLRNAIGNASATGLSWETFWHSSKGVFLSLMVGGTLTGIVVGIAGYFLTLAMVRTAREKAQRLRRKKSG